MVNGEWSMVNGQWRMVNGEWSMVNKSLKGQKLTILERQVEQEFAFASMQRD